ncbi:MAG: globin [Chloroflexota bacterium]|nr:globin [Dehalococcoidia bacterium]MDW8252290.1 globin [Chloroflexota bacterium]
MSNRRSIYDQVGGEATFFALVDRFYAGVATDPILRPMYPEGDLAEARRKLALFFIQYFGGPMTYSAERGHPRLRMRHLPFPIDKAARDAWMRHMHRALDETPLPEEIRAEMRAYFERTATFLINRVPDGTLPVRSVVEPSEH